MSRPSPLLSVLSARGATFGEACGVQVARRFGEAAAEARAVRSGVGLFDLAHRGLIEIAGPDRARWFKGMCTNEVLALTPGQGNLTALVNRLGRMVSDAWLAVTEASLWLELNADRAALTAEHLEKFHIIEKVQITDRSLAEGLVGLHGPQAAAVLERVLGQPGPAGPEGAVTLGAIAGVPVRVQRQDESGDPGYSVAAPVAGLSQVFEAIERVGAPLGLRLAGFDALEILRIEAGRPTFGAELTDALMPIEAGLTHAVSYTKGCYLGQEVIARVSTLGQPARALVGIAAAGELVPARGDAVVCGGVDVGRVTSAARSPHLNRTIALAVVRREHAAPGTRAELRSASGAAPIEAEIVPLPFLRRTGA